LGSLETFFIFKFMKKIIALIFCIAIADQALSTGLPKYHKKGRMASKSFNLTLDSYIGTKHRIIIRNVQVGNLDKRYNFILDTGSGTYISESLANDLKLNIVHTESVTDGYSYEKVNYGLTNIGIQGVEFEDIITGVMTEDIGSGVVCDIDGIIGNNIMRFCVWQFIDGKVTITDDTNNLTIKDYYDQKLTYSSRYFLPFVEAGLGGQFRTDSFIDLGSNSFFTLSSYECSLIPNKKVLKGKGHFISTLNIADTHSDESDVTIAEVPEFNFGNAGKKWGKFSYENKTQIVQNVHIDVEDAKYLSFKTIGSEILDFYSIIIDYPKKRFYSRIIEDYNQPSFRSFGFSVKPDENSGFEIAVVWDNSSASLKGLKPGSKLIQINQLNLEKLLETHPACEIYESIKHEIMSNEKVLILIQNDSNNIEKFELEKSNLLD